MTGSDKPALRPSLTQRLLAGVSWAIVGKIVSVCASLIVNAVLARVLTEEEMGAYFLTVSLTAFAAILGSLGLRQTVVRVIAESLAQKQGGRARETVRIVFRAVAAGSLLVGGGYYWCAGEWLARDVFEMPVLLTALELTALWIVALALQAPLAEFFRGLHDIRVAVFLDGILSNVVLAIALLALIFLGLGFDYTYAVLLTTLAAIASLLVGVFLFWRRREILRGDGTIAAAELAGISAPLFIANLAHYSINQFSLWIAGANLNADDVAIYGAAWRLMNILAMPLLLMNMTVNPVIAELHATGGKKSLQSALRGTATVAAVPAFVVLLLYIGFSANVLEVVYGAPYRSGAPVLVILSVGMLANVWTGSCSQVLAMTGHQHHLMMITVGTGIFSVIISLYAVQFWGLFGIATAVSVGLIIQNCIGWLTVYRLTGLWTHGTLRPKFIREAVRRVRKR